MYYLYCIPHTLYAYRHSTLDFEELHEGLCKYHNAANDGKSEDEIKIATRKLMEGDVNGDNVLDKEEFACAMVSYADSCGADVHELIDFMVVVTALDSKSASKG